MAASAFYSPVLPPRFQSPFPRRPPPRRARPHGDRKPLRSVGAASNHGDTDGHREHQEGIVDENMKALRRRIRAVEAMDRGDGQLLEEWVQWDQKRYHHTFFQSDSYEILGLLQLYPVDSRPSFAIGVTVMVRLSVPISVLLVVLYLKDAAKEILDRMHPDDEISTNH